MEKDISNAVIKRLPRYYRYLGELMERKIERISSGELSRIMHVTASQIRQDLNTEDIDTYMSSIHESYRIYIESIKGGD